MKEVVQYVREPKIPCVDRSGSLHLAGDGLCAEIAPDVFEMHDDGLAYVTCANKKGLCMSGSDPEHRMGGDGGLVDVPEHLLDAVVEAAEECPG